MRIIIPTLNSDLVKGRYSRYVACSIGVWPYLRLYDIEYALGVGFPCSRLYFGKYLLPFELVLDVKTGRSQPKHLPLATGSATLVELIDSDAIEFVTLCGPSCSFVGVSAFQESSSGSVDLVRAVFAELFFHESSFGRFLPTATGFCVMV